jgi:hypothetical protein
VVGTVVVVLLVISAAAAAAVVLEGGAYFDSCGCISVVECFVPVGEEAAVSFLDKSMGRARRGTIKRRSRKSTIACNFVVVLHSGDFLVGAMKLKSVIMSHPPVIQKGSISMNHFKTPNQDIEKMVADGKEVLQF